ncbi:filamentous haemagglutinin family protein [Tardiphaga sp.]|uniref:filamentous haemagglutinin family protein n=1 Tax=Tardiphaga sp. TaxID=1926292 RepID=UPI0025EDACDE|nr:filamentous haemagglutinin family protein [Tardiphaga sp.]
MRSSNGDVDAGRGARTTLSFPPLKVNFNQDDIQTVDLGGLVSGTGIRVSDDLGILALCVANAANIQVGGKSSGVPTVEAPNIGGLTAANNTASAAAKPRCLQASAGLPALGDHRRSARLWQRRRHADAAHAEK